MDYKVKPMKSDSGESPVTSKEDRFPTVMIPYDKAGLSKLSAGDDCEVTLKGKIIGIRVVDPEKNWDRNEFTLEVHNVSMDDSEYKELVED